MCALERSSELPFLPHCTSKCPSQPLRGGAQKLMVFLLVSRAPLPQRSVSHLQLRLGPTLALSHLQRSKPRLLKHCRMVEKDWPIRDGLQKAKECIVPSLLLMRTVIITCVGGTVWTSRAGTVAVMGCDLEADELLVGRFECELRCLHSLSVGPGRDWSISEQRQRIGSRGLALWDDSRVSSIRPLRPLWPLQFLYLVSHGVTLCPQTHKKGRSTAGCGGLGVGCGAEGLPSALLFNSSQNPAS